MGFRTFFKNTEETNQFHIDKDLKTKYFDINYKQFLQFITEIAPKNQWNIVSENDKYGEIFVSGPKYEFIFTYSELRRHTCSVDVKIIMNSVFGFGKPKKRIMEFYQVLGKKYQLKGVALS